MPAFRNLKGKGASDSIVALPRRQFSNHIPRPRNSFIFFRSHFNRKAGGQDQNQVSIMAANAWKKLSAEEKWPFVCMAEEEKRDYQIRYPGYTYAPRSKGKKEKTKKSQRKARSIPETNAGLTRSTSPASSCPSTISLPTLPNFLSTSSVHTPAAEIAMPQPVNAAMPPFVSASDISPMVLPVPSPILQKADQFWEYYSMPLPPSLMASDGSYTFPSMPFFSENCSVVDDWLEEWNKETTFSGSDPYPSGWFFPEVHQDSSYPVSELDPRPFVKPDDGDCMQFLCQF